MLLKVATEFIKFLFEKENKKIEILDTKKIDDNKYEITMKGKEKTKRKTVLTFNDKELQ